jgi:hypothetical protein
LLAFVVSSSRDQQQTQINTIALLYGKEPTSISSKPFLRRAFILKIVLIEGNSWAPEYVKTWPLDFLGVRFHRTALEDLNYLSKTSSHQHGRRYPKAHG